MPAGSVTAVYVRPTAAAGPDRLPHSELAVARAYGGCEDKGRWFALLLKAVTAKPGDYGAGSIAVRDWRD
ncbi:MAG: hypothetical protein WBH47_27155 [Streptosporangiaceae bacterium]